MKTVALALMLGVSPVPQVPPVEGVHRADAPVPEPMKRFAWRDEAAGYTFVAPPRWAGKVRVVPLTSEELSRCGAVSGVRFVEGAKTLLVLLSSEETRLHSLTSAGATEISRHGGHIVAVKVGTADDELALTDEELGSAIQWDGEAKGAASR
ncbi:hypothetical protein HBF26_18410 [Luteibacter jiangsuensis]|uniref:Uncharacterized protein n=1 Tax=Luteibacter jiangsuensis TaxID=637577 RepID=A0ABX0Q985_9GAMM|nr:hypothetical protein [Luteibacter jiangsuensis]NID06866.1 hypothetical protein [Luteibacter jiangsuensis]